MTKRRSQINLRRDDELEADIDFIRRNSPAPIPDVTATIRAALRDKRRAIEAKLERQQQQVSR
jgi:hypothetical protein